MKCIYCNSELEGYSEEYYFLCNMCDVRYNIHDNEILWAEKCRYIDLQEFSVVYWRYCDETVLYINGGQTLSIKGKQDLSSLLSKGEMIKVFS